MGSSTLLSGAAARSGLLGFTAGLRSQVPLALLALNASASGPAVLRKRFVPTSLYLSAAGEIVVDKLPVVPSRLESGPLAGRMMFGSVAGAVLARRLAVPAVACVMAGAAGAVAGSFAGFHARSWVGRKTGLSDPLWAVAEDAVAITLGSFAARK